MVILTIVATTDHGMAVQAGVLDGIHGADGMVVSLGDGVLHGGIIHGTTLGITHGMAVIMDLLMAMDIMAVTTLIMVIAIIEDLTIIMETHVLHTLIEGIQTEWDIKVRIEDNMVLTHNLSTEILMEIEMV